MLGTLILTCLAHPPAKQNTIKHNKCKSIPKMKKKPTVLETKDRNFLLSFFDLDTWQQQLCSGEELAKPQRAQLAWAGLVQNDGFSVMANGKQHTNSHDTLHQQM
jgi:hypothetical protein